jgi:hypothetical protein
MKANELRIGNIVYFGIVLEPIALNVIHPESTTVLMAEPIPISEKWLLKLGFLKTSSETYMHPKLNKLEAYKHPMKDGWGIVLKDFYSIPSCIYVHNLQNLYHSLTGEELKINET